MNKNINAFNILILQMVSIFVILLSAFVIRLLGGRFYSNILEIYNNTIKQETSASLVTEQEDESKVYLQQEEIEILPVSTENVISNDVFNDEDIGYVFDFDVINKNGVYENELPVNSIIWPVDGRVSSEYGYRTNPITGIYSMHGGIDIAANKGSDIKSVIDGTVKLTGYSNSYGYYIIISHTNSVETLYAHCSEIISNKGDRIKKGTVVAKVGSTGQSTGPHCHFEIRLSGKRINPRWLLGEETTV